MQNQMIERARMAVLGSVSHRIFHDIKTLHIRNRVMSQPVKRVEGAICLSPYRSGTTYFSQLFPGRRVAHEPMHAITLRRIDDDAFLAARRAYLDLDLECSGFLSLHAKDIMARWPDCRFIMLARQPTKWAQSILKYFSKDDFRRMHYNYVEQYFFERIGAKGISHYQELSEARKQAIFEALIAYWIQVYTAGMAAPNCLVVPLDNLPACASQIADHLGMEPVFHPDTWRRASRGKAIGLDAEMSPLLAAAQDLYARI